MRAVVQRCNWCKITLENGEVSETGKGLVVLLGVGKEDNDNDVNYIADKVMNMRVFEDENQKMNLSLKDVNGELAIVSQFTLYGDMRKGRRPSFFERKLRNVPMNYITSSLRGAEIPECMSRQESFRPI